MSQRSARAEVPEALERLEEATRRLVDGARRGDLELILGSLTERAAVVDLLERAASSSDNPVARIVGRERMQAISLQAEEAESALRRLKSSIREELGILAGGSKAIRGYAAHPVDPSALDRSG